MDKNNKVSFTDIVDFITFLNCLKPDLVNIKIGKRDGEDVTVWDALTKQEVYKKFNNIIDDQRNIK